VIGTGLRELGVTLVAFAAAWAALMIAGYWLGHSKRSREMEK